MLQALCPLLRTQSQVWAARSSQWRQEACVPCKLWNGSSTFVWTARDQSCQQRKNLTLSIAGDPTRPMQTSNDLTSTETHAIKPKGATPQANATETPVQILETSAKPLASTTDDAVGASGPTPAKRKKPTSATKATKAKKASNTALTTKHTSDAEGERSGSLSTDENKPAPKKRTKEKKRAQASWKHNSSQGCQRCRVNNFECKFLGAGGSPVSVKSDNQIQTVVS